MEIDGGLYRDTFDPINPYHNKLANRMTRCDNEQFRVHSLLQKNTTYILMVRSLNTEQMGALSIMSLGEGYVSFVHMGKCGSQEILT